MEADSPYILNPNLPPGIDRTWETRIEEAFVPENPRAMDTDTGLRVLKAIERNLKVSNEIRAHLIQSVQFVNEDLAREAYAALNATDTSFDDATNTFGIISVRDHNQWIYPAFQFEKGETGLAVVQEVEQQFRNEVNGWAITSWWNAEHPRLEWHSPYEVFKMFPALVLRTLD